MFEELNKFDGAPTLSHCYVTSCYNMKYRFIIHTMLPKFSNNYRIACESALHQSVRNVLDVMFA